jgi:N-methylhydantoinase B
MAHWIDIGGTLGARTQDIYSEGLQLPIVKIFKRGVQDDELTRIIRTNVRVPELAMGDFRAQIAAIRTGEARYGALLNKYGLAAVNSSIAGVYALTERLARASVAAIPDGTYEAESYMDDDGITSAPIPIKVKVIVAGDQMTIDLSDVSPQVQGYFNSGATAGRSAAQVAFKCVTTPTQYPINDGAFRNLNIILPPGRVISATKPAAMRWWMTIPMTVVDTIFRALAPAIPDRVAAGHHADLCVGTMYGINPRTGRFYVGSTNPPGGGWGAIATGDGMNAVVCINDGDTHNAVIEALEAKNPLVIERYALRTDSGGPGLRRGGLGLELRVRAAAPMRTNVHVERTKCAPWGLAGGGEALANRVHLERAGGANFSSGNGKLDNEQLTPGDVLVIESGGGGGYGNPHERPRATVADDVRNGYVSHAAAVRDYGMTDADLS